MSNKTMYENEQRILTEAIEAWSPTNIICLFSGGYDSMIATDLIYSHLDTHGLPVKVWSIDTMLSADGWTNFVSMVAESFGWNHVIDRNELGFSQFEKSVELIGCPRGRAAHTNVFRMLKERSIDKAHMMHKKKRSDKTLFISGMRRAESNDRRNSDESHRIGHSNKIFAAPIVHWSNEECMTYRIGNDLPENPFYDTVKGSGDCQCNWGNFITFGALQKYSPLLADGNVKLVHELSLRHHGYGWDGTQEHTLIDMPEIQSREEVLTSPFLCRGCSRGNPTPPNKKDIEQVMIQRGMW